MTQTFVPSSPFLNFNNEHKKMPPMRQAVYVIHSMKPFFHYSTLRDLLYPWLVFTELEIESVLQVQLEALLEGYQRISNAFSPDTINLLEEEQIQEIACRMLQSIPVFQGVISDDSVEVTSVTHIKWCEVTWKVIISNRTHESFSSYKESLAALRKNASLENSMNL